MSLLERAQRAEGEQIVSQSSESALVERLREQVNGIVSADAIARIHAENPERARNELRRACVQAFDDIFWAAVDEGQRAGLVERLIDSMFGFGPLEGLLADAEVTEVMVNGPHAVFYERGGKIYPSSQSFSDDGQLRTLIDRILGPLGRRIDEASPMVNARLPQGHRVNAVIPPLSPDGPVLTIRKFTERVMTLEDMMGLGSLDSATRRFLEWAVLMRKNIAVSGGTGSGKTTLLNALSCVIPPGERIITIEDSLELRFLEHPHVVRLEARPRNAEGAGEVTIRDLVTNALRMRPDRIVVGECRGAEALDMLQAMTTGHDGSLTTLHANSPAEVVSRLTTMVRFEADLPVDVVEAYIASAIDVVVQTARAVDGSRYVCEVAEFAYDQELRRCVVKPLFRRGPLEADGSWVASPEWVREVPLFGWASGREVELWLGESRCAA